MKAPPVLNLIGAIIIGNAALLMFIDKHYILAAIDLILCIWNCLCYEYAEE